MNSQYPDSSQSPQGNQPAGEIPPAQPAAAPMARVSIQLEAKEPGVTFVIVGVTVLFFILQQASLYFLGFDLPASLGAKINEYILKGQIWRLFTPMLLHGSLTHIFFNMYALVSIGREIEMYYGHKRYLVLYLVSGFAGNVFSFLITQGASYGASTAIFGLIAAEGVFIYRNRKFFRNSRAMLINVAVIVGINLFIVGMIPNIDNFGHLGGLLGGAAFAWLAGPIWSPQGIFPDIVISDIRKNSRTLPVSIGVCALFAFGAALKFFM
jgi:rhomboid protease GluP